MEFMNTNFCNLVKIKSHREVEQKSFFALHLIRIFFCVKSPPFDRINTVMGSLQVQIVFSEILNQSSQKIICKLIIRLTFNLVIIISSISFSYRRCVREYVVI